MITVAKWNQLVDYDRLLYPNIKYQNGVDLPDLQQSGYILFSIDLDPPAISINLFHDSLDQGIVQNTLEYELPEYDQDRDSEYIHYVLLHASNQLYPNGFERITDKEMVERIVGLAAVIELYTNPQLREKLKNVQK